MSFLLALLAPIWAFAGGDGIWMVDLKGSINPGSASYILESLKVVQNTDSNLFIIKMDTPGGLLTSTRSIIQGISESKIPVVVWVAPSGASATSAGALIALSAHAIAMHTGSNIGAAHPVGGAGEDIKGAMGEKITNDTAALARSQAALNGRNVNAAEGIVTKSHSFSATEAVQKHIAEFIADDESSLLRQINGKTFKVGIPSHPFVVHLRPDDTISLMDMTPKQRFLNFIADPNVSALLLSLGGLCVWAEVSSGFSSIAAGIVGIFCFVLGLISLQTLPVTTGGEILLVMGIVFLVTDAFVTNHGLLTVAALISITLGGLFLIDPGSGSMHVSLGLLLPLVGALGVVVGLVGWQLSRDREWHDKGLVGAHARVSTVEAGGLSGTAYVNGELWTFDTAQPVAAGDELVVGSVHGLKIHLTRRS